MYICLSNCPTEKETFLDPFVLRDLLPTSLGSYYRYTGSLTTPPCSEIVEWIIFRKPVPISYHQVCFIHQWDLLESQGDGRDLWRSPSPTPRWKQVLDLPSLMRCFQTPRCNAVSRKILLTEWEVSVNYFFSNIVSEQEPSVFRRQHNVKPGFLSVIYLVLFSLRLN